jgi:hypothetical protein
MDVEHVRLDLEARAVEELRPEAAGLADRDADADRCEVAVQPFGEAFEGEFGRVVEAPARVAVEAADRADVDHVI